MITFAAPFMYLFILKGQLGSSFLSQWDLSPVYVDWSPRFPGGKPSQGPVSVAVIAGQDDTHSLGSSGCQPSTPSSSSRSLWSHLPPIGAGCGGVIDQGKLHIESYFKLSSRNKGGMPKHKVTHRKEKNHLKKYIF